MPLCVRDRQHCQGTIKEGATPKCHQVNGAGCGVVVRWIMQKLYEALLVQNRLAVDGVENETDGVEKRSLVVRRCSGLNSLRRREA